MADPDAAATLSPEDRAQAVALAALIAAPLRSLKVPMRDAVLKQVNWLLGRAEDGA
jgi:hypothetical protein